MTRIARDSPHPLSRGGENPSRHPSPATLRAAFDRTTTAVTLVIDNYDSFTFNLVQVLGELGAAPEVVRNDALTVAEAAARRPDRVVISPGPGSPERAGISVVLVQELAGRVPILGVCLGQQAIAQAFGGRIRRARRLVHGKTSPVRHNGAELFAGLANPFAATRYHSLVADEPLPRELEVTARSDDREVMALRHRSAPLWGVQFHPESILTPEGPKLLRNFLDRTGIPK